MKQFLSILTFFYSLSIIAQPNLKPSIGIGNLPSDTDTICNFPVFLGDFLTSGYAIGDTIPDFTLYTTAGLAVNMQTVLGQGKPVLLIGGNLTCPVFRGKLADINNMASIYAGQLQIYIVYGMEAHPTTPSPYSGQIWLTNANQQSGILHAQPTTYGERKALIDTLLTLGSISPPILVDGPCNEWLSNFGPAPNNAYLIDTTGIIYEKQGWFHKLPDDMYCEIDSFLGTTSGLCNAAGNNGTFTVTYPNDTIEYGDTGDILGVHATITNTSSTDNAVITIIRHMVNVPTNWQTAMCIDVCLPQGQDTAYVTVPPGMTQDFIFYFYTDPVVPGIGMSRVAFINNNINQNKFFRRFWGETSSKTAVQKVQDQAESLQLYPNPTTGMIFMRCAEPFEALVQVVDLNGRIRQDFGYQLLENQQALDMSSLPAGLYLVEMTNQEQRISKKIILR